MMGGDTVTNGVSVGPQPPKRFYWKHKSEAEIEIEASNMGNRLMITHTSGHGQKRKYEIISVRPAEKWFGRWGYTLTTTPGPQYWVPCSENGEIDGLEQATFDALIALTGLPAAGGEDPEPQAQAAQKPNLEPQPEPQAEEEGVEDEDAKFEEMWAKMEAEAGLHEMGVAEEEPEMQRKMGVAAEGDQPALEAVASEADVASGMAGSAGSGTGAEAGVGAGSGEPPPPLTEKYAAEKLEELADLVVSSRTEKEEMDTAFAAFQKEAKAGPLSAPGVKYQVFKEKSYIYYEQKIKEKQLAAQRELWIVWARILRKASARSEATMGRQARLDEELTLTQEENLQMIRAHGRMSTKYRQAKEKLIEGMQQRVKTMVASEKLDVKVGDFLRQQELDDEELELGSEAYALNRKFRDLEIRLMALKQGNK